MHHASRLNDFLLHLGQDDGHMRCALLRNLGETYIPAGTVRATRNVGGGYELEIEAGQQKLILPNIEDRHLEAIRGHGLYVIQFPEAGGAADGTLMQWSTK